LRPSGVERRSCRIWVVLHRKLGDVQPFGALVAPAWWRPLGLGLGLAFVWLVVVALVAVTPVVQDSESPALGRTVERDGAG
jgi:hypothetical protein